MSRESCFIKVPDIYDISTPIGHGGYGKVYIGKRRNNFQRFEDKFPQEVAIKVISYNRFVTEGSLINEINVLSSVHCRNVNRLIACMLSSHSIEDSNNLSDEWKMILDQQKTIIVMPYFSNKSIVNRSPDFIRDIAKYATNITKIIYGIINGMVVLHHKKIIHADLKGLNILLDENLEAVITDFGLSSLPDPELKFGTPLYAPPDNLVTFKGDVFSFGVVLVELFCDSIENSNIVQVKKDGFGHYHVDKITDNDWTSKYRKCLVKSLFFDKIYRAGLRLYPKVEDGHGIELPPLLFDLACKCTEPNPDERPSFTEIAEFFKQKVIEALDDPSLIGKFFPVGTDIKVVYDYIFTPEERIRIQKPIQPDAQCIDIPEPENYVFEYF